MQLSALAESILNLEATARDTEAFSKKVQALLETQAATLAEQKRLLEALGKSMSPAQQSARLQPLQNAIISEVFNGLSTVQINLSDYMRIMADMTVERTSSKIEGRRQKKRLNIKEPLIKCCSQPRQLRYT